jgi:hypothetical protein
LELPVKFVHIVVFSPVRVFIQNAIICSIFLFAFKVGDAGPILDMFAVVLETISTNVVLSRTTASAILRAAHIVSVVPNVSYHKKVFPDALFHQLLLAMSHADCTTRVEAHNIFSVVLLGTLRLPWSDQHKETSEAVSGSLSVDGICTVRNQEEEKEKVEKSLNSELCKDVNHISRPSVSGQTSQQLSCQSLDSLKDLDDGIKSLCSLRLSSHQVNMLLSSLWIQATSTDNTPENFEAMASTYQITLLFSLAKVSRYFYSSFIVY